MPHLLVISQSHNLWGGIETWMRDLFPRMAAKKWNVQFALTDGYWHNNAAKFAKNHSYVGNYRVIDGRGATPRSRQYAIFKELKSTPCDVLMPIAVGDVLPAFRQHRRAGNDTRICIPVHSLFPSMLADIANNADIIDVVGVVSRLLYCWTAETLPSTSMQIRLIRNGAPRPLVNRSPRSSAVLRVGFVGRLESEHKRAFDVMTILRCLQGLGERVSLTIVGDGPLAPKISEEAAHMAGFHNISILGSVTRDHLYREVYPNLDCLLLTSTDEGQPLVLIEAMRHGVVPVSSQFVGHATEGLLDPGQNCLTFPIGDTAEAALCFQRLGRAPILLEKLAARAISSAAVYNQKSMVQGWVEACEAALASERRPLDMNSLLESPVSGRLDRLGLPVAVVDFIRKIRNKKTMPNSGWDEWPGTLNADKELEQCIVDKLDAIERARSAALYGLHV